MNIFDKKILRSKKILNLRMWFWSKISILQDQLQSTSLNKNSEEHKTREASTDVWLDFIRVSFDFHLTFIRLSFDSPLETLVWRLQTGVRVESQFEVYLNTIKVSLLAASNGWRQLLGCELGVRWRRPHKAPKRFISKTTIILFNSLSKVILNCSATMMAGHQMALVWTSSAVMIHHYEIEFAK